MGNLIQLLFTCGNYFRDKNIELVTDAHFGHFVPVAYLRLWKVFVTSSFLAKQRIGISAIKELSNDKLNEQQLNALLTGVEEDLKEGNVDEVDSETESDDSAVGQSDPKRKVVKLLSRAKTNMDFFEKKISLKPKGSYKVWMTTFQILPERSISLYLHAINDSKPVYRISTRYAALPLVELNVTANNDETGRKEKVSVLTTQAHRCFRKKMAFNDKSDSKRSRIALSAKHYRRWPQKLVAKTLEDCIINAYANYLLDPSCPVESWPTFLYNLVQEFIDSGEDMRVRRKKDDVRFKSLHDRGIKRPRPASPVVLRRGINCPGDSLAKIKEVPRISRTKQCAFCGRRCAPYKCRSCNMHLCMKTPKKSEDGKIYPVNGPCCFLRHHGFSSFPKG